MQTLVENIPSKLTAKYKIGERITWQNIIKIAQIENEELGVLYPLVEDQLTVERKRKILEIKNKPISSFKSI